MLRHFAPYSLMLALLFTARLGHAQTDTTVRAAPVHALLRSPSALRDWVNRRSSEVFASRAQVEQARADARGSRLFPNPIADFTVGNIPVSSTNPTGLGVQDTLVYGAGISELFEIGKRGPRAAAADLRVTAASRRSYSTLAGRVADARDALGRALYAKARFKALDESLQAARQSAAIAEGRLQHQALAGVDYDRLLLDLSSLEADSTRTRAEAEAAQATCTAMLLAPCDLQGSDIADLDALSTGAAPATLEQRSDIAALRLEGEASRRDATLAGRRAIPDVTLRLGYTHSQFTISGDNANTVSVSAALPIPLFDRGQHDKAKALARAEELEHVARAAVREARGGIAALGTRERALNQTLTALEKDALPRANAVLKAQEKGLAEGQLDMTDLLLARRQAIALKLQVIDLRFELFGVKNDLRRLLGQDDPAAQQAR